MEKQLTKGEIKLLQKKFNSIVRETARGNFECWVDLPEFRKVKAEITDIDFRNIIWKPIGVRFLEEFNRTDKELVYGEGCWCPDECEGHWEDVTTRYIDDVVKVDWVTIIKNKK